MSRRILITGGSIAGNATAALLGRHGFDVTVVERAAAFRDGGQNVDVRGVGREVLRRMGLEQAALDRGTGEEGTVWVDENGREAARFAADDIDGDGPTAEMEILRGDLARLLHDAVQGRATYRFGDHIAAIDDDPDAAIVTFASGMTERYDLVIVAEGVGSATRELVFPHENASRWMNLTLAYFTIPRTAGDDRMWRWYNAPGKRSVSLRPDRQGTTRAMLSLSKAAEGEQDWSVARQKAFLRERFADAGWETPRILSAMEGADDFYFDVLRQVRMNRWSNARVVLTGDAAWCATPLSGIGTTLAIVGAYVLAGELAATEDHAAAFASYERIVRPFVKQGQSVPKIVPRLLWPHTRAGLAVMRGAMRLAATPLLRKAISQSFARNANAIELPRYKTIAAE